MHIASARFSLTHGWQVVRDDDVAGPLYRDEDLVEIGLEGDPIHGSVEQRRRD